MPSRYPPAIWRGDGKSGGSWYPETNPYRVVLHTTETAGLPSYNDGYSAPHMTYDPKRRIWYQHTSLDYAARALRNTIGGVQTNRSRALQVEIICYSARTIAEGFSSRLWVGDLPDTAYEDLRAFIAWAGVEFGVRAEGPGHRRRMSAEEWNGYRGVCGHDNVPENTHWDPGAFSYTKLFDTKAGEREFMYPIRLRDGTLEQRPEKKEDVRFIQALVGRLNPDYTDRGGVATQELLDLVFGLVGSPAGGSYIDGVEGLALSGLYAESFAPDVARLASRRWVRRNFLRNKTPYILSEGP